MSATLLVRSSAVANERYAAQFAQVESRMSATLLNSLKWNRE